MCLQSAIALSGFYLVTQLFSTSLPFGRECLRSSFIAGLFATTDGRQFLDYGMDLKWCVLIHSIRIFVEINLFWLFTYKRGSGPDDIEAGNLDICRTHRSVHLVGLQQRTHWKDGIADLEWPLPAQRFECIYTAMLSAPFSLSAVRVRPADDRDSSFSVRSASGIHVPAVLLCHLVVFRKLLGRTLS